MLPPTLSATLWRRIHTGVLVNMLFTHNDTNTYMYIHREIYHGKRWMNGPRLVTPMVPLPNGQQAFVNDCVTFAHPKFGLTAGIVIKYYLKVVC